MSEGNGDDEMLGKLQAAVGANEPVHDRLRLVREIVKRFDPSHGQKGRGYRNNEEDLTHGHAWTGLCIMEDWTTVCLAGAEELEKPENLWAKELEDLRENIGIMEIRSLILAHIVPAVEAAWLDIPEELREDGKDKDGTEWGMCFDFDYVPYWLRLNLSQLLKDWRAGIL